MVLLEKRETRQFSLSVRGLKARGPAESSNLINERVNYAQIADVDLGSTPEGFQITITTDRLQVKFFVAEEWRAQNAVDSLRDLFYRIRSAWGLFGSNTGIKVQAVERCTP